MSWTHPKCMLCMREWDNLSSGGLYQRDECDGSCHFKQKITRYGSHVIETSSSGMLDTKSTSGEEDLFNNGRK